MKFVKLRTRNGELAKVTNLAAQEEPGEEQEDDNLVATIGQRNITANEIVENLIINAEWQALETCLDRFLLEEEFSLREITATQEEVRSELTIFRKHNQLSTGDETHKWLEHRHMHDSDFMQLCRYRVKLQKLKDLLFEKRLEEYFIYKRAQLQTVELYKIVVAKEEAAREIVSSVRDGESFFDYARKYSLDEKTAKAGGYTGTLQLAQLHPTVQDLVLKSRVGDLIGPVHLHKRFDIYLLDSIESPLFEGDIRQQLEDELFQQWLADTRTRAGIKLFV